MGKWVTLIEVLRTPEKYGDISNRRIAYIPDQSSVTIKAKHIGYGEDQTLETQQDLTYYPVFYKGEAYLVAGDVTKKKLAIYGKAGYENGAKAIRDVQMLYGNSELGAKCETWRLDNVDILEKLPNIIKQTTAEWWMQAKYSYCSKNGTPVLGMYCMNVESTAYFILYRKRGSSSYDYPSNCAIRPFIKLLPNTLVRIGTTGCGPLEIRRFDSNLLLEKA